MTREQVEEARQDGYQAGYQLAPHTPNPYAPETVPPWRQPREPAALADWQRQRAIQRILAQTWRVAYRKGKAANGRETGRDYLAELTTD